MDTTVIGGGFLILGLVVWIVCVYYAVQMAPKRGRGAGTWGVLTFFFGPLALMLLAVLPSKKGTSGHHLQ
jgi:hypothetical protein